MKQKTTVKSIANALVGIVVYFFAALVTALLSIGIGLMLFIAAFFGRKLWLASVIGILNTLGETALGSLKAELDKQKIEFKNQSKK